MDDYDSDHCDYSWPTKKITIYPTLKVKKVSKHAILPKKSTPGSAGFDLYSVEDGVIFPAQGSNCPIQSFDTGLVVQLPTDPYGYYQCYGRIAPRSGLAFHHGIDVLAGVIDPDYRGTIKVILVNHGPSSVKIAKGDRIAQLILEQYISTAKVVEVTDLSGTDLSSTSRGDGGFGSTGV